MIELLLSFILILILFALVFWAIKYLGLPDIVQRVAVVLFVVLAVVVIIYFVTGLFGWVPPRPARW